MDKNRVIGKGNIIPWHLPADFAHFRKTTAGCPIIMGLNTYKSIGRPLPNRTNIVLSKDDEKIEGCLIVHSLEEAFAVAKSAVAKSYGVTKKKSENIFVVGGASVYEQALPFADQLNLTLIDAEVEGDIYFPEFNHDEWKEISREERKANEENIYDIAFVKYVKK